MLPCGVGIGTFGGVVALASRLVLLGALVALFSLGWFGALAVIEAHVGGAWVWGVGLVVGSMCFGVFVTALRDGVAADLLAPLLRRR